MTYKNRATRSCGPDGLFSALRRLNPLITQVEVDRAWGIDDIRKFQNLGDTPWNHFAVLEKLGILHELISFEDILRGKAIHAQTLILIHNVPKDPEVRSIFTELRSAIKANLEEDWIVFDRLVKIVDNVIEVRCFFGDETVKSIKSAKLEKMMNSGFVRCAYVVGRGRKSISRWAKFYGWLTGKFY